MKTALNNYHKNKLKAKMVEFAGFHNIFFQNNMFKEIIKMLIFNQYLMFI